MTQEYNITETIDKLRFFENSIKIMTTEGSTMQISIKKGEGKNNIAPDVFTSFKAEDDMYKAFLSYLKKEALLLKEQLKTELDIESYIYTEEK